MKHGSPCMMMMLMAVGLLAACAAKEADSQDEADTSTEQQNISIIQLTSSAFAAGQRIPKRYTGEGEDLSPPLSWSGVPEKTGSLAIIVDDPDAPRPEPWVHWVIYNLPGDATGLPEGVPREAELSRPVTGLQGVNGWPKDNIGYRGPMPPPGSGDHHYRFHLYALDAKLALDAKVTKAQLLKAMEGHILARGELLGTYSR